MQNNIPFNSNDCTGTEDEDDFLSMSLQGSIFRDADDINVDSFVPTYHSN